MVKVQMVEPLCDAFSIFCLCFGSFANQLRQELLALNSITVERKIFFLDRVKNFEIISTTALCLGLRLPFGSFTSCNLEKLCFLQGCIVLVTILGRAVMVT